MSEQGASNDFEPWLAHEFAATGAVTGVRMTIEEVAPP